LLKGLDFESILTLIGSYKNRKVKQIIQSFLEKLGLDSKDS